ncbi:hypothetical protein PPERSA_07898 [Pseudocohnilembus persalinus]|uniref:GtrA/DPMS transmembrane domain-containing protein n=1 Tax=Pseudocohnilembus persalinus TaxID=266149 RepID=A0A0V0QXN2_PSEPJ|nr:hypothetical protein PPERSA_07898 [Pseudocohnilembus persalinus]|eukprot:KRX06664.1 hypothetical protein PPERSA_07898 [Pseudocohnilembus persalinus]
MTMSSRFLKNYDCSMDLEQIEEEENENAQIAEPIFVNLNNDKFKQSDTPQLYFKCMEKYPKVIRYFIAGILGNIVLYLLDRFFLEFNPFDWQKETVAWTLSNIFHTPAQYILFEKLTFGEKENKIKGILGVYMSYSVGTVVGIIMNYILINQFSMNNDHAWLITLILTAFVNFVMVSYFMKNPYDHAIRETEKQQNQLQTLQNANEVQDGQKSNSSQLENQQQQNLDIETGIVVENLSKEQQKQKQFQFKYPFPSQVQRQQQKRLYYAKIWRTASTESDQ